MHKRRMRELIMLAAVLMAMVSLSIAACPRLTSDLYTGANCGGILDVAAPGFLANDIHDPGATLSVVDPEKITIDPRYGSIVVRADGSFTYTAAEDMNPLTYIGFYYNATDGKCTTTRHALVKIAVTCKCQVKVPPSPIYYCMPVTIDEIRDDLRERGAGCVGCGTPGTIDLSQVDVNEEGCYPYYVTDCGGCSRGQGEVCLVGPCTAQADDIQVCEGTVNIDQLMEMARDNSSCTGCTGPDVEIFDVQVDGNGYVIAGGYYIATCHSVCGDVRDRGEITVWQLCDARAEDIYVCPGTEIETVIGWAEDNSSCDNCQDAVKAVDASHITTDETGIVTGGYYTVTCTVGPGCKSMDRGEVIVESCTIDAIGVCIIRHSFLPEPTAQDILDEGLVICDCGEPVIYDISFVGSVNDYLQKWHYKAYCRTEHGCTVFGESDFEWGECGQEPCPCHAHAPDLTICADTFSKGEVEAMLEANATCGGGVCETQPTLANNLIEVGGYVPVGTYTYTVTCDPEGSICPTTTETGTVHVIPCPGCCDAVAPRMCTCVGDELTNADFIEQGAGCIGTNCPQPTINTVGVDYYTPGLYDYTVTCGSGCEPAEGTVCVEDLVCAVHTGTYGTADLINDYGEVMGTATVSIGGFNRLNVNLAPKNGWTILDSRLYAGGEPVGGCDPDLFSYQSTDDMTYTVVMGSIDGWHCGEPLHVNVYAEMQKGEDVIEECTGDIVVDGYYTEVCDLDPCWDCETCGGA